jgi:succinyl-diaminopimelate desuccinylase
MDGALKQAFEHGFAAERERLTAFCRRLVATDSCHPPGDTRAVAALCSAELAVPGVEIREILPHGAFASVVAIVRGPRPGRRLVMNGHLDTGPVAAANAWTVPPFGGVIRDGNLYGPGSADMKAGVAALVFALRALARAREHLAGEAVLTLVGDEGGGGRWGTRWLLDNLPEATGDALLSADVGSPAVARFGEKGFVWLELTASGRATGAASKHLGANAVDRLVDALARLRALEGPGAAPPEIVAAVRDAAATVGEAEAAAILNIGVSAGLIAGGRKANMVPDRATAEVDIRFPPGERLAAIIERAERAVADVPGVGLRMLEGSDPTWTSPGAEIVRLLAGHAAGVTGRAPALAPRLGFSDSRLFRERGMDAVVYGAAARNSAGADDHVALADLEVIHRVHALTALDYLAA